MSVLIFDTETTGFLVKDLDPTHSEQPDVVQLAALLYDGGGREVAALSTLVQPSKPIAPGAFKAHGISSEIASSHGVTPLEAMTMFAGMLKNAKVIVAHNLEFDAKVMLAAWHRTFGEDFRTALVDKRAFCTMKAMTNIAKIMHARPRHAKDYKWPKLSECVEFLFGEKLLGAHDALVDARACARVYFEIQARRNQERLSAETLPQPVLLQEAHG